MVTFFFRSRKDIRLNRVESVRPGVWVHAEEPDEQEIQALCRDLQVEETLLRDALDRYEVPRFEIENNVAYFFTRGVFKKNNETRTAPILLAIGGTFVLTVTPQKLEVLARLSQKDSPIVTTQKTRWFIYLMLALTASYTNALTEVRREVQRSRRRIEEIRSKDIIRFVSLEDTLTEFITALVPTNVALKELIERNILDMFPQDENEMEELLHANDQVVESARSLQQTIAAIRSTYATITTQNLNQVIKLLTALTIILTVPTIVSSFFGMNVAVPLQNNPRAFWLIAAGTLFTSSLIGYFFAKKEWL